jgi:dipeptidyl aminopeptidase/acylaminoacyl peptidase
MDRSAKNGFRCAVYPEPEKIPAAASALVKFQGNPFLAVDMNEFAKLKPVDDPVFQIYKEQFSYDRTRLNERVESKKDSADWTLEKVAFDAAYAGERVAAYVFLPKNATPPYQAVIYMGGDAPVFQRSSQDIENYYEVPMFFAFLVKNGRAVLYPVYKGFFERGSDALLPIIETGGGTHQWVEVLIQQVKDLRRSIDYLETRPDIDSRKLAFYSLSYGSGLAPIILAVEDRLKVSVLQAGGFMGQGGIPLPEVNPVNYLGRVKHPILMLNGTYDSIFPPETSSKPMFRLLGTPAGDKRQIFYDTDHVPPYNEYVKETLAWLDKYLGPVKR